MQTFKVRLTRTHSYDLLIKANDAKEAEAKFENAKGLKYGLPQNIKEQTDFKTVLLNK